MCIAVLLQQSLLPASIESMHPALCQHMRLGWVWVGKPKGELTGGGGGLADFGGGLADFGGGLADTAAAATPGSGGGLDFGGGDGGEAEAPCMCGQ